MQTRRRLTLGSIAWLALWAGSCLAQANLATSPEISASTVSGVQRVNDTYFYLLSDTAGTHQTLMAREQKETTAGQKLFDLETLTPGDHSSRFEIQPSWNGKYVAIGVSQGREGYSIRILDVAAGALLPDLIVRSFDGDASWSDNNHAFCYRKFQQLSVGAPRNAIFTNMRVYLHNLGDDPGMDQPVFGPDVNADPPLPAVGAVNAFPLPGTPLLLGVQSSAPAELDSFWVNDTQGEPHRWRKIIDHADEVLFEFSSRKSTLYFITRHNQPKGQVMAFDAAREDIAGARKIFPESDLQLTDRRRDGVLCAKDALYVYGHRDGGSALIRVPYGDPKRSTEIALPFRGVIADVSGDSRTDGLVFSLVGDAHSLTVYKYDPSRNEFIDTRLTQ